MSLLSCLSARQVYLIGSLYTQEHPVTAVVLRNQMKETSCSTSTGCLPAAYKKKVKWSLYRPGVAQRVGISIALLFHDRGTRRGWVVSSTPRPHFTPGIDPVPISQEAGWPQTGDSSRPHRDSIPDRPARSQSLYRLSYPAHASGI